MRRHRSSPIDSTSFRANEVLPEPVPPATPMRIAMRGAGIMPLLMGKALRYAFEEAFSGLLRRRILTVVSIATIGASLGVFGLFFAIARSGGALVDSLASKVQVVVYLSPRLSVAERSSL